MSIKYNFFDYTERVKDFYCHNFLSCANNFPFFIFFISITISLNCDTIMRIDGTKMGELCDLLSMSCDDSSSFVRSLEEKRQTFARERGMKFREMSAKEK
jgi:hypothetical protein